MACLLTAALALEAAAQGSRRPVPRRAPLATVLTTNTLVVTEPPPNMRRPTPRRTVAPTPRPTPVSRSAPTPKPKKTPRPTPAPTPVPRPYHKRFTMPTSPDEAMGLIYDCYADVLRFNDPATSAARCNKGIEIINAVDRYLINLDQQHSTIDSYKWYFIDRERIGDGILRETFNARPAIQNVSAISFAADYGDIYLYSASVFASKANVTTFPIQRVVEENYPHREICYLFFPTSVSAVTVKCGVRRHKSRAPRLTVFAGVAREEEYLKQARWYLRYARRELEKAILNRSASRTHVEVARKNLGHARERLALFRKKQKY